MKRITKKEIKEIKKNYERDTLKWGVLNILDKQDNILEYLEQVLQHGCGSGFVNELVYYNQTEKWFKKYCIDIMELLQDTKENIGEIKIDFDYNTLAWFSFEETCYNIIHELRIEY